MNLTFKRVSGYTLILAVVAGLVHSFLQINQNQQVEGSLELTHSTKQETFNVYNGEQNEIFVRIRSNKYEIVEAVEYYPYLDHDGKMILMKDYTLDDSPGNPMLPYIRKDIALPPAAKPNSIKLEIVQRKEIEVPDEIVIAPAPPYLLDQDSIIVERENFGWELSKWGERKKIREGKNIEIYEKDEFYPVDYCKVNASGQLRKWKAASLIFYPVRYNPVSSKLVLTEEILVKITFEKDREYLAKEKSLELLRDDKFDKRAKKIFVNYNQAKVWYQNAISDSKSKQIEDPNFTIVTTDAIYTNSTQLANFCFHKQDLGFTVMVVTEHDNHTVSGMPGAYVFTDAAGGYEDVIGENPNQTDEKIRKWLQDNYLALGIEYVLLMGNPDPDNVEDGDLVGDIPMQICWTALDGDYPTDYYFADLTGNWNLDGDEYIGEKYPPTDPALGYSVSSLDPLVTANNFCVRWEGVIHLEDAAAPVYTYLAGSCEGQLKVWIDEDNDGFDNIDVVVDDAVEHLTWFLYGGKMLSDGDYPVKIEYTQSGDDAFCSLEAGANGGSAQLMHDDGTGNFVANLEADYFNNNDFSGAAVFENVENPDVEYIIDGDRGVGGVDFYPELIVGRIPFYGEDEDADGNPDYNILDGILSKIMAYENALAQDEDWRRRVLISTPHMYGDIADYEGGEYLRDQIAPTSLWDWYRIHDEDYGVAAEVTTGCSAAETADGWNDPADPNDGRGVVMWRTHGSQTGASHVLTDGNIGDLDDNFPSIMLQTTCKNGLPEASLSGGVWHYPFGYSLLRHGAISSFCSTRNSSGGLFNSALINIDHKNNPYLMYFLAKGVFNNNRLGDVLMHIKACDALFEGSWNQIFNYNLYGDPTLSLFGHRLKTTNEIVFLLDGSGSMLSEGKWDAAVDATVLFYDLQKALRHPAFDDKYNTVVFRWGCNSDDDNTTTVPPGTGMKDLSIPIDAATLVPYEPENTNCTPIGSGLQMAIDQFDLGSEESFYSNKTILLLSDGKQNRGIDPLLIDVPDEIKVQAIGLGEDYIEPETIRDIAEASGGDYRITPTPREVEDFFLQILCNTSWKLQNIPVVGTTVTIDQDIAVFVVAWDDPADAISFDLAPPGAIGNITPANTGTFAPMEVEYHAPDPGETHAYYVCKNIQADQIGDWQFVNINNAGVAVPVADVLLKVVEDPRVIADFSFDPSDHFISQPIVLQATLTENGRPLSGLTDVYAELQSTPNYAIGDLLAENSPADNYPVQPTSKSDKTLRAHYLQGVMENKNIESLNNSPLTKIVLKDDGVGYDLRAGDGIYTGAYSNTDNEGSYTFEFYAKGTNTAGHQFTRSETLSEYVKFQAASSTSDVKVVSQVKGADNLTSSSVSVSVKSSKGSYLGPFRADKIKFITSNGKLDSSYTDKLNGTYIFKLVHASDVKPKITLVVGDAVIKDNMLVKIRLIDQVWFRLILLFLLFIILLVYIIRTYRH